MKGCSQFAGRDRSTSTRVGVDSSPLTADEIVPTIRYSRPRHWDLHCCRRRGRLHRSAEWGSVEVQAPS
jgi:hypothetical protein